MDQRIAPTDGRTKYAARGIAAALSVLVIAVLTGATPAAADNSIVVPSPVISGTTPPYGPGFDTGVVIRRQDGCRSVVNCAPGNYQNRPAHRRYYDNYFDVPTPRYSGQRRVNGTPAIGGTSRLNQATTGHAEWCSTRYRSYRASDDTFQPFDGPRRPCVSPF